MNSKSPRNRDCQSPNAETSSNTLLNDSNNVTSRTSTLGFLRTKLKKFSLWTLLRLELEGFMLWIFNGVPGIIGFSLRYSMLKILCKKLSGFIWIQPRSTFVYTDKLTIGHTFACNSGCYINAIGSISIGDNVLLGTNVTISSGIHPIEGKEPPVFSRQCIPEPIVIEDDVWIGAGAVILPGVTLRRGTVVGANAVVTKDTAEYSVVVGLPAKCIRHRY